MPESAYRGRFAPSPTGPLHFGSLVAAVASYLEARRNRGIWILRMEDLDPPRTIPGIAEVILYTLRLYGFTWDEPVVFQSEREVAYAAALERLRRQDATFPCACTRREIGDSALSLSGEPVYPGTCREGLQPGKAARAMRAKVGDAAIAFDDAVQGRVEQNLPQQVGDFVVRRADGIFAYQLAVVVDDADQGITHVVRGADLLDSTPRQILLQRLLGHATPDYTHVPVAVDGAGNKLGKQTQAVPLATDDPAPHLRRALNFLGMDAPPALARGTPGQVWSWAVERWDPAQIPRTRTLPAGL